MVGLIEGGRHWIWSHLEEILFTEINNEGKAAGKKGRG